MGAAMTTQGQRVSPTRVRLIVGWMAFAAWLVACAADIGAAASYVYFEPTDEALANAAAAAARGEVLSVVVVAVAVAVAVVRRQRMLVVLALPGVAGVTAFVSRPSGHGLPLIALLATTLLAGAMAVAAVSSRPNRRS